MVPVVPSNSNSYTFEPLRMMGTLQQTLGVSTHHQGRPAIRRSYIEGKRIGVKELFDIAGLRPALGNKAFLNVSSLSERTAPAIVKLLDLGAILLGTTKCSSMISREDPVEGMSRI